MGNGSAIGPTKYLAINKDMFIFLQMNALKCTYMYMILANLHIKCGCVTSHVYMFYCYKP